MIHARTLSHIITHKLIKRNHAPSKTTAKEATNNPELCIRVAAYVNDANMIMATIINILLSIFSIRSVNHVSSLLIRQCRPKKSHLKIDYSVIVTYGVISYESTNRKISPYLLILAKYRYDMQFFSLPCYLSLGSIYYLRKYNKKEHPFSFESGYTTNTKAWSFHDISDRISA